MKDEDVERRASNVNPCSGVLQSAACDPQPATPKSIAVFVIGMVALIALWLPPLFVISDFPGHLRARGERPIYWDYLIIPLLFLYALWITWKSRPTLAESGLGLANFPAALRNLLWPTLLGTVALIVIGLATHRLDAQSFGGESRFWKRLIPVPAFFQQMAIQLIFHRQLMPWFGAGRKTCALLAVYFALLHLPNPGLAAGTLFGMYFWARCYQRTPNLYALALSHAFLSALFMETMPKWLLPSVSVGWRFVEKVWLISS